MIFSIARFIFMLYFFVFYKFKVTGKEKIPKNGGVVVCSNHISNLDPLALNVAFNRKVCFMGKKELFKNKFIAKLFAALGAYPVDRDSADMAAYKTTVGLLKNGSVVGIFAQGKRVNEMDVKGAKAGVSLFAIKSKSPIVPVGIISSYKLFSPITVKIGDPIYLTSYENIKLKTEALNEITESVMKKVNELL